MRRAYFGFVMVLLFASFALRADDRLSFTASDDGWAVLVNASGEATTHAPFLRVKLDSMVLQFGQTTSPSVDVRGFRIGLAYGKPNGGWTVDRWSDTITQKLTLTPGTSQSVGPVDTLVPIDGLATLANHWLVIAVEVESGGMITTCYAHNKAGILARN